MKTRICQRSLITTVFNFSHSRFNITLLPLVFCFVVIKKLPIGYVLSPEGSVIVEKKPQLSIRHCWKSIVKKLLFCLLEDSRRNIKQFWKGIFSSKVSEPKISAKEQIKYHYHWIIYYSCIKHFTISDITNICTYPHRKTLHSVRWICFLFRSESHPLIIASPLGLYKVSLNKQTSWSSKRPPDARTQRNQYRK